MTNDTKAPERMLQEDEVRGMEKALECLGHITQAEDRDAAQALIDQMKGGE